MPNPPSFTGMYHVAAALLRDAEFPVSESWTDVFGELSLANRLIKS